MKRWYVAQVYAGYEDIVRKDLLRRINETNDQRFGQVLVPSVRLKNLFAVDEEEEDERLFPGYILIEMELDQATLNMVTSTPKVLKFLGGETPAPLTTKEVERIVAQVEGGVVVPTATKSEFVVGGEIDISDGPFSGFVGIVEKIDEESERLTVMVSIFGRLTPVELTFDQVKK
jgi:transcriptional antiterminator NusG